MKVFCVVLAVAFLVSTSAFGELSAYRLPGEDRLDVNKFQDSFTVPPRIVSVSIRGVIRHICFSYITAKSGNVRAMSVLDMGPGRSCSGEVADYLSLSDDEAEQRALSAQNARFTGRPHDEAWYAGASRKFVLAPGAVYYRAMDAETGEFLVDPKTGAPLWDAVCVGLMKPKEKDKVEFHSIVYPRENSHEAITGFRTPEVKCGGIQFAVRNEIPTEKPKLLGNAEELEKLTQRTGDGARAESSGRRQARPNH